MPIESVVRTSGFVEFGPVPVMSAWASRAWIRSQRQSTESGSRVERGIIRANPSGRQDGSALASFTARPPDPLG
jgi:hypothetical protein